jgi:hypothetical protein
MMRSYEDKKNWHPLRYFNFSSSRMSQWFRVLAGGIYGMFMRGILHTIFMVQSKVEPPKLRYSLKSHNWT